MTKMYDDVGTGIMGTAGTTELQLGANSTAAGSAIVVPDKARALLEVIPYQAGNAIVTASESIITQMRLDSNDVTSMIPKKFILPVIFGGLSTTVTHVISALMAFPMNTALGGGERINVYGQPLVANTTATIVGADMCYSDIGTRGAEEFYQSTTNTTITAPAAGTRSAGANVTITGGSVINYLMPHIASVVSTAAQAYIGVAEFVSSDFQFSYPYKVPVQPVGGFLGSSLAGFLANLNGDRYFLDEPIPIARGQTIVNTFYTGRVLQTGNVNFNTTIGYTK